MPTCSRCGAPAVTYLRHAGRHLCADHFRELVERRAQHAIRDQCELRGGGTVAVAVILTKGTLIPTQTPGLGIEGDLAPP